ncbi:amino acid ABC transporter permease [Kribbella sp. NPDC051587]|uniref:amino acid ABC transporter permease n=1 Tax=Kribbella sp. NPDC051587 TaxID=3364119 RepID=UPI0037AFFF93
MSGSSVLFDAPGPKAKRLYLGVGVLSVVAILAALWFVIDRFNAKGQLTAAKWKPFLTGEIWTQYILPGLGGTLVAAGISIVFAMIVGVLLGVGRLSTSAWIRIPCSVIVEFFRAVPVLLMMLFTFALYAFYEIFPPERYALAAVVTALTLYNGAVVAELVRSGVFALPKGQSEAGMAIGLTRSQSMRIILLPQAITAMLPAIVGQLVVVLKDTALGYIITYEELLRKAEQIGNYKSNLVPAFIVIGAIFILINYLLTVVAHRVEKVMRNRGRSAGGPLTANPIDQPGGIAPIDLAADSGGVSS